MDIKINCEKNQLQLDKLLIVRRAAHKVLVRVLAGQPHRQSVFLIASDLIGTIYTRR